MILLSSYISFNLLLALAFLILMTTHFILPRTGKNLSSSDNLSLHYRVLRGIFLLGLLLPFLPPPKIFEPALKVWSAPSSKSFRQNFQPESAPRYVSVGSGSRFVSPEAMGGPWLMLIPLVVGLGFLLWVRDLRRLYTILKRSYLVRKVGRVGIFSSDHISVPLSFWWWGKSQVIIPQRWLGDKSRDIILRHELQHHRQGDTRWMYVFYFLKVFCCWNPLVHWWIRQINEIQEFACDEALVDRNKVDSQAYASCLVEVAQTALFQRSLPACATGLVFLKDRKLLTRRIHKMLQVKSRWGRSMSALILTVVGSLLVLSAYASKNVVQDRRISKVQAIAMASKVKSGEFRVVVNDRVLEELNRYLGTPEGRDYMRLSLLRMENFRPLVQEKMKEYSIPPEIMAVPLIESGYQNLEENGVKGRGAGVWMFIKSTARAFGLQVDQQVDERLNVELETDAAMRYLMINKLRFKDWHLSLLSYNIGENAVQKAITRTGSRDAWTLIRGGYENDRNYLPKVMAAIIIMNNPESLN